MSKKEKKRSSKKKSNYIPHKAAANFKPTYDWKKKEALQEYNETEWRNAEVDLNTIYYEDCIKGMKRLPPNSIDQVIADPPFGLDFNKLQALYNRNGDHVVTGYEDIKIENYKDFTYKWIEQLPRIMKTHAGVWLFSGWSNLKDVLNALDDNNLTTVNHIIWKYQFGAFTKHKFVSSHYHLLFAVKDENNYFFNKIEHYPEDVWIIKRRYHKGIKKNATKLPMKVVLRCIDFGSKPGSVVLDPFMGNGTTATACKGSFRHFIGFEINKELKDIIESNINLIKLGQFYKKYSTRPDKIVIEARKKFKEKKKNTNA